MRIEEPQTKILTLASIVSNNKNETKCTKMTDENDTTIKNGINGALSSISAALTTTIQVSRANPILPGTNASNRLQQNQGLSATGNQVSNCDFGRIPTSTNNSSAVKDSRANHSTPGVGGRLQFFKDGKFILELARSKEGEKFGWISVPRKAFRSPSAVTSVITPTYPKNESCTSLSFSDDNSSIQSSPWQRDHSWKQSSPRKAISKELCMFYKRSDGLRLTSDGYKLAKVKKRRPCDKKTCPNAFIAKGTVKNGSSNIKVEENSAEGSSSEAKQTESSPCGDGEKEKVKVKMEVNGETRLERGAKLNKIIQILNISTQAKLFALSTKTALVGGINSISASTSSRLAESHHHQPHVSPRKRILREFEKVSLEDNKRSRAKGNSPLLKTTSSPSSKANATTSINSNSQYQNGTATSQTMTAAKPYSSYSINSLLGNNNNGTSQKEKAQITTSSDQAHLRSMLTSPKSPETNNHQFGKLSPYSTGGNSRKRSPQYSPLHDIHHSRIRSPTAEHIYGNLRSPESGHSRALYTARSTPPLVHPYLASNATDNHKMKSADYHCPPQHPSNSPNHYYFPGYLSSPKYPPTLSPGHPGSPNNNNSRVPHGSRSPGSFAAMPQPLMNRNRDREASPANNIRENLPSPGNNPEQTTTTTPRTVPKKTVSIRQQFAPSSTPSPSPNQADHYHSKSSSDLKHPHIKEEPHQTDHKHPHIKEEQHQTDHKHSNMMRSSPVATSMSIPTSSMYYLYPPNNVSPSSHPSPSSYIPPGPYYHQYAAAAIAAMRNPVWMHHYPPGVLPPHAAPSSRMLPSPFFPYNGVGATGLAAASASHLHSPLTAMHLSAGHLDIGPPLNHQSPSTEEPASLISIKEEPSSDVPLNLSKH